MTALLAPANPRGMMFVRADSPLAEVNAAIAAMQNQWNEIQSSLTERLQEDVLTQNKISALTSSVADMQLAIDQANASLAANSINGPGGNVVADPEYTEAFNAHFRSGVVQANLNKGTDQSGGYLAPIEWDRTVGMQLVEISPMRAIANIVSIETAGFTKLFLVGKPAVGWVSESGARGQTGTPAFDRMEYVAHELFAQPGITQQLLDDAVLDLDVWLAGEVATEFAKAEGLAFVGGDGAGKPVGFLNYVTGGSHAATHPYGAIQVGVTAASATEFTAAEVTRLIYSLPSTYTSGARLVLNRSSLGAVMQLQDASGWPLWQPTLSAGQPATLRGYPTTEMPAMPSVGAGTIPMAFGDFQRGYQIVDRHGLRIIRDAYTAKPNILFYTTKRVGGGLLDPQPIRVMRMAAA